MRNRPAFADLCTLGPRKRLVVLCLTVCSVGLGLSRSAHAQAIITFDVPGAVNGTFPSSINPSGAITGVYLDASLANHGFLRTADGTFTLFDAPDSLLTVPVSINPAGAIAPASAGTSSARRDGAGSGRSAC